MTRTLTTSALALTMAVGSFGLVGCGDRTVDSTETSRTRSDGSTEVKKTETSVNNDTGAVKKETTVERHNTNP